MECGIFCHFCHFPCKIGTQNKQKKIKQSIIEFYKLHKTKGHWYTYEQWKGCDLFRATIYQTRAERNQP